MLRAWLGVLSLSESETQGAQQIQAYSTGTLKGISDIMFEGRGFLPEGGPPHLSKGRLPAMAEQMRGGAARCPRT